VIKPAAAIPDSFGGLSLGLTDAKVVALIGEPAAKGQEMEEGASGQTLSDWRWPARGVTLSMAKGDGWTVASITLAAPSEAKSVDGIGVGSTHADVMTAYAKFVATDTQSNDTQITLGSIYGGVFFELADGKVTKIFVGAGAE
jgi:hypothetical protein